MSKLTILVQTMLQYHTWRKNIAIRKGGSRNLCWGELNFKIFNVIKFIYNKKVIKWYCSLKLCLMRFWSIKFIYNRIYIYIFNKISKLSWKYQNYCENIKIFVKSSNFSWNPRDCREILLNKSDRDKTAQTFVNAFFS